MEKLSSKKLVSGAKNVGGHWNRLCQVTDLGTDFGGIPTISFHHQHGPKYIVVRPGLMRVNINYTHVTQTLSYAVYLSDTKTLSNKGVSSLNPDRLSLE